MTSMYTELFTGKLDHPAMIQEGAVFTYADFHRRIEAYAVYLDGLGVRSGDRVALGPLPKPEFLAAAYGCFRIGAAAVPVPGDDEEELRVISESCGVVHVLREAVGNTTGSTPVCAHPEALIIATSGTTGGQRKNVILGHDGIAGTAAFMNRAMQVDGSICEYVLAPLDHAFGFGRCHAVLRMGGTLLFDQRGPNFRHLFEAIETGSCNAISVVPSVLVSLLRFGEERLHAASERLRWVQTGAMRLDLSYRNRLCDALPHSRLCLHYGLSEAMRSTFFDLNEFPEKRHTEGRPADDVDVGIFTPEGERLAAGEEGIIRIRGRNVALGYTDSRIWEQCVDDGWFVTSDLGKLDEDGFLVFLGRNDDAINTNGYVVHPQAVESRLASLLAGRAYCVAGMADPQGVKDNLIVLFVEGGEAIATGTLKAAFAESEHYMVPHKVVISPQLPRTRTGKVVRRQLTEQHARDAAADGRTNGH